MNEKKASGEKTDRIDGDKAPIEVSILGVKARLQSSTTAHTGPKNAKDLWHRCRRHLLQLVELPLALAASAARTAINVVGGLGGYFVRPPVQAFEDEAEKLEGERRETTQATNIATSSTGEPAGPTVKLTETSRLEDAVNSVSEILDAFQEKGLQVEIQDLGRGRVGIFIVPPDELPTVTEVVENKTLPRLEVDEALDADSTALDRAVAELDLSLISLGALHKLGVKTVRQLVRLSKDDLLALDGFGDASLDEVRGQLMVLGMRLKGD